MTGSGYDWLVVYLGAFFLVWNVSVPLWSEATILNTALVMFWSYTLTTKCREMRRVGR